MLFPKARIIHCVRDPLDTCLSLYSQNFERENEFAYDLEHIAAYYHFYRMMMAHWQSVLPIRILDVAFESLVEDRERVTRGLIEHCGLTWDARCLHGIETGLVASSVSTWQRYARHLTPLIGALAEHGYVARPA